jgi:hypothetical protein
VVKIKLRNRFLARKAKQVEEALRDAARGLAASTATRPHGVNRMHAKMRVGTVGDTAPFGVLVQLTHNDGSALDELYTSAQFEGKNTHEDRSADRGDGWGGGGGGGGVRWITCGRDPAVPIPVCKPGAATRRAAAGRVAVEVTGRAQRLPARAPATGRTARGRASAPSAPFTPRSPWRRTPTTWTCRSGAACEWRVAQARVGATVFVASLPVGGCAG